MRNTLWAYSVPLSPRFASESGCWPQSKASTNVANNGFSPKNQLPVIADFIVKQGMQGRTLLGILVGKSVAPDEGQFLIGTCFAVFPVGFDGASGTPYQGEDGEKQSQPKWPTQFDPHRMPKLIPDRSWQWQPYSQPNTPKAHLLNQKLLIKNNFPR